MDSILATRRVGPTGTVIGIDMTAAMLDKAKRNAVSADVANIEFRLGEADELPVEDETIDVVITNGVFNLCLNGRQGFRLLKPLNRPVIISGAEVRPSGDVEFGPSGMKLEACCDIYRWNVISCFAKDSVSIRPSG